VWRVTEGYFRRAYFPSRREKGAQNEPSWVETISAESHSSDVAARRAQAGKKKGVGTVAPTPQTFQANSD